MESRGGSCLRMTISRGKIHIEIPKGEGGLSKDSVAHCGQIRAIDKERIFEKLGIFEHYRMALIGSGLRIALDVHF